MRLIQIQEAVAFEDEYPVRISGYGDQPILAIPGVGFIRLFYTSGAGHPHYEVHMIRGESQGAATPLYFAALDWALRHGDKDARGLLSSGLTLSPDAVRARARFQRLYDYYLYIFPHPDAEEVKVHKGDNSEWRRQATSEEAGMWRLRREAPFRFVYG